MFRKRLQKVLEAAKYHKAITFVREPIFHFCVYPSCVPWYARTASHYGHVEGKKLLLLIYKAMSSQGTVTIGSIYLYL